jgi:hypothetical protein
MDSGIGHLCGLGKCIIQIITNAIDVYLNVGLSRSERKIFVT